MAVGEEQVLEALEFDASEVMVEIVEMPLRAAEGMRVREAQKMQKGEVYRRRSGKTALTGLVGLVA